MVFKSLLKLKNKIETYRHRRYVYKAIESGLHLGKNVTIMSDVRFDPPHNSLISIGDNTTICPEVAFIAHDASIFKPLNHSRLGFINIKENCFIGQRAIILPGVTIGPNAVIGAGAVVAEDIPENSVASGNPAKVIGSYLDYLDKNKDRFNQFPVFEYKEFYQNIQLHLKRIFSDENPAKVFYTKNQIESLKATFRFNITKK
jgi:maltose O-acetyltransferase